MNTEEQLLVLLGMTEQQQAAIAVQIKEFQQKIERLEMIVKSAITESVNNTAGTTKKAVDDALAPTLQNVNGTIKAANNANERLKQTIEHLGWQTGLMVACFVVTVSICTYSIVWWQQEEIQTGRENLASQDFLKRQIKITNCGGSPCVEIDTSALEYQNYRILKGVRFK